MHYFKLSSLSNRFWHTHSSPLKQASTSVSLNSIQHFHNTFELRFVIEYPFTRIPPSSTISLSLFLTPPPPLFFATGNLCIMLVACPKPKDNSLLLYSTSLFPNVQWHGKLCGRKHTGTQASTCYTRASTLTNVLYASVLSPASAFNFSIVIYLRKHPIHQERNS